MGATSPVSILNCTLAFLVKPIYSTNYIITKGSFGRVRVNSAIDFALGTFQVIFTIMNECNYCVNRFCWFLAFSLIDYPTHIV